MSIILNLLQKICKKTSFYIMFNILDEVCISDCMKIKHKGLLVVPTDPFGFESL